MQNISYNPMSEGSADQGLEFSYFEGFPYPFHGFEWPVVQRLEVSYSDRHVPSHSSDLSVICAFHIVRQGCTISGCLEPK